MTKAEIRQKVWQTIQREGAARFPGALGRVPNFAGAERAAQLLREMAVWRRALVVKVNPDAPQLPVRRLALAEGKILYMAVPRLRTERSEEHTSELQSRENLVCRHLLEKKKQKNWRGDGAKEVKVKSKGDVVGEEL